MDINRVLPGRPVVPSQNLVNPVKRVTIRPDGYFKSIILDALSVFSALGFGYAYYRYLTGSSPWFVFGALLVFAAFEALQVFLARNFARRAFVLVGETIAIVVLFFVYDNWQIALTAGLIAFVVLLWGYIMSRAEFKNGIEIQFFRMTRSVLGKVTTAAILIMIIVYAPQTSNGQGLFVPRESFRTFFDWAAGFLNGFYPGIPFNQSFGNFSQAIAKMELENNPTFLAMNQNEQNAAVTSASTQIANGLAGPNGAAPSPSDQVSDVIYNYIVKLLGGWQSHLQDKFLIAWVIVLFFLLRTIGIVFVWLSQFVSLIFYEIFLASGFMRVAESTETKETIVY